MKLTDNVKPFILNFIIRLNEFINIKHKHGNSYYL